MAVLIEDAGQVGASLGLRSKAHLDPKMSVQYIHQLDSLIPYLPNYSLVIVEDGDEAGTIWQLQPDDSWIQLNVSGNLDIINDTIVSDENVYSNLHVENTFAKKENVYDKDTADSTFGTLVQQETNTHDIATLIERTNSLSSAMRFRGSVATYGELLLLENPQVGDLYFIDFDETKDGLNTKYIYNGSEWIFNGVNELAIRDFQVEPIILGEERNLEDGSTIWFTEVTGKLKLNNLDLGELNAANIIYDNEDFPTVKDALDELLYKELVITFTTSSPTTLEKGRVISNPQFTFGYNKAIVQHNINGTVIPINERTYTHNGNVTTNTTFTISASDERRTYTKNIKFNYYDAIYYGSAVDGTYDETFVESLIGKELKGSANGNYTINCADGEYIFFAIPSAIANNLIFSCNGFDGGIAEMSTVTVENQYGVQCNYTVFKSDNHSLGNTTITIR